MKLSCSHGQDMLAGRRAPLESQHKIVEIIKIYCRLSLVCSVVLYANVSGTTLVAARHYFCVGVVSDSGCCTSRDTSLDVITITHTQ